MSTNIVRREPHQDQTCYNTKLEDLNLCDEDLNLCDEDLNLCDEDLNLCDESLREEEVRQLKIQGSMLFQLF